MAIADWSTVAADNNTTLGVNIAEGCPAANVNNAIRKLMADVATGVNFSLLGSFLASTTLSQAQSALGVPATSTSLTNFGALTNTANKVPYMTGSDGWALDDRFPSGAILMFGMNSAPSGWLECDGSAVSRTTYATLFALIGTTHGTGDGSTTFNVPDLRGEFVRGWDHGKGTDSGRAFGSAQTDQNKAHTHDTAYGFGGTGVEGNSGGTNFSKTSTSSGGTEARPRNIALMFAIKT
jgi:hypothetical protein